MALVALLIILLWLLSYTRLQSQKPTLHVSWHDDTRSYGRSDFRLRLWPLFKSFNLAACMQQKLPEGVIHLRAQPELSVSGAELSQKLENLVKDIEAGSYDFQEFTILRSRNFYKKYCSGSLILKFNDAPFVVKLFLENPPSFVSPFFKGWDALAIYLCGGGINRHLSGFTRLHNLELIGSLLQDCRWSGQVELPRKWFWAPKNVRLLKLSGTDFAIQIDPVVIPSVYAIIADYIEPENNFSLFKPTTWAAQYHDATLTIALCSFLQFRIDPNVGNIVREKHSRKLVIIDTEHYPTLAGICDRPWWTRSYLLFVIFGFAYFVRNMIFGLTHPLGIPFDKK